MAIQPSHSPRALNLLDRQGYGAVLYVSASRQLRLETASDLEQFRKPLPDPTLSKKAAAFYSCQNEQIDDFLEMEEHIHNITADVRVPPVAPIQNAFYYHNARLSTDADEALSSGGSSKTTDFWKRQALYAVTLCSLLHVCLASVNFLLFWITGSLSVASSALDSFLDFIVSVLLNVSAWLSRVPDPYNYPYGKTRIEPIGILFFSVIMGISSLAVVAEAAQKIIKVLTGSDASNSGESVQTYIFALVYLLNVTIKLAIVIHCRIVARHTESANNVGLCSTIAKDKAFDLTFGAAMISSASENKLWFLDPSIAIILSLLVASNWISDARQHIQRLVGKTAGPRTIAQLIYLAIRHDERIMFVDDVKAVHFGECLMAEVHVGLSPETILRESHDIGESLQIKLEGLETIEIAHVHSDYMYCHPWKEHKPTY